MKRRLATARSIRRHPYVPATSHVRARIRYAGGMEYVTASPSPPPHLTTLTPEVESKACEYAREGIPLVFVAGLLRVHRDTLHQWLRLGAEGDARHAPFYAAVTEARAEYVRESARLIAGAPKGHMGRQWLLERVYPEFRSRSEVEQTGGGASVQVRLDGIDRLTPEQLSALAGWSRGARQVEVPASPRVIDARAEVVAPKPDLFGRTNPGPRKPAAPKKRGRPLGSKNKPR